ncbi:Transcription initiation factor TFIID component TAF4 [Penicillium brevicompactum]|uniref:Transcription initiation factor TFIID subunit 4 n=1 Tax=Penicillium brevicompactum TaxID=5074 RepID=A0A9W9QZ58_PENBR|nr:Transcription initiation factor TFIID component TAF4 [Penicillium brevicompactum]
MAQARHPQQQQPVPPPQFSNQPFSPPVSSPSPNSVASPVNGAVAPPPNKRPRLSPLPPSQTQSPYGSPSFNAMQLPQNPSPMNGQPMNMNTMNMTPAPATPAPAPPGTMGPPSRPVDKTTDAAELTDVLASSGIDVREEEAFLTRSFSGQTAQAQPPQRGPQTQHPPPINTSFNSQVSAGTLSASTSFGELPQIKPQTTHDSYADPSSQASAPFKDPNEPTREDTVAARRAQYHIQEPFLITKLLEQKLQKRGFDLGVRIPSEGLFHPVPGRPQPIEVTGPDGSSVVRTGQTILNQEGAPLVDILNLLSISAEERIRGVIDYSSTLARSRRSHSHGVVPGEWKDVAQPLAQTTGNPQSLQTPVKRPHSSTELGTKSNADRFRTILNREGSQEERRASKRAKRNSNAILSEAGRADSVDPTGSAPSTPIGERPPGTDKKSITKKEAKKMTDSKATEAQQHAQSVETARMALGNSGPRTSMFGTKKSYSWLKSGGSGSGFSSPSRPTPSTPTAGPEKPSAGEPTPSTTQRRLGLWREDQDRGAGIQVRDVLFMLEADGRATRHVQRGYLKDPKEDRDHAQ